MLSRLKANDANEQASFWRQHRPGVLALARRVLGPTSEAEELADEVLVDFLYVAVHRIDHEEAIRNYVRLMTVRRALRRSKRRRKQTPFGEAHFAAPNDPDELTFKLMMPRLEGCLEGLTPKARQALTLRYRGEMTTEHIGKIVGGSKQYIGRLLTKSLEALRGCIDAKEVEHAGETPQSAARERP
jgi:RNA polymerase sigma factor (sigma-70 family)